MPRAAKPPVKAACLPCRSSKTRCDGHHPCGICTGKKRDCHYQPSRRGGPRRGVRYEEAQRKSNTSNTSISDVTEEFEPFLDNMIGLVTPFAGIHNLDLSPEALSVGHGAQQIWGQLTPHADSALDSATQAGAESPMMRAYHSEGDIINAYYLYLHSYLPLLPPSVVPQYEDRPTVIRPFGEISQAEKSQLPYWPESSLALALSAMLSLIPVSEDQLPTTDASLTLRRSYAQLFAQTALAAVEKEIDDLSPGLGAVPDTGSSEVRSSLHRRLPAQLEPILALVVLGVYEYIQRGNVSRIRARVNQAITTAMDISLHSLDDTMTEFSEAQRRVWWITLWSTYLSSNINLASPILSFHDPRITTPYPKFDVYLQPWPVIMKAQEALFEANKMVQNIERVDETTDLSDFSGRIQRLDAKIVSLMTEADRHLLATFDETPEASVAQTMWMISRLFIHTARVRLHRFRAFMDIPLFLDKYCDLTSINSHGFSPSMCTPKWATDSDNPFPFTEQESSNICLKSSLAIVSIFRSLPSPMCLDRQTTGVHDSSFGSVKYPRIIPVFACSGMQGCYALLMLLHRLRACMATDRLATCYHLLNKPGPASEISDVERLTEELRHGVEILVRSMKSAVIFEGVGGMGREIEGAYMAAFPDCPGI
ncbi:hypothetical protein PENANT_c027G08591 [Penicillium antarcticum]|uniref:Zn(2)-C6 fungal-type domain-containing protein n=1 Tax=Penicillium antarcticum TaxID=416450 RepID=A0A1V6PWV3_9EURO|nr:hypothetical protein PENANT_c027G08591 [Penicillium antarcticum]